MERPSSADAGALSLSIYSDGHRDDADLHIGHSCFGQSLALLLLKIIFYFVPYYGTFWGSLFIIFSRLLKQIQAGFCFSPVIFGYFGPYYLAMGQKPGPSKRKHRPDRHLWSLGVFFLTPFVFFSFFLDFCLRPRPVDRKRLHGHGGLLLCDLAPS